MGRGRLQKVQLDSRAPAALASSLSLSRTGARCCVLAPSSFRAGRRLRSPELSSFAGAVARCTGCFGVASVGLACGIRGSGASVEVGAVRSASRGGSNTRLQLTARSFRPACGSVRRLGLRFARALQLRSGPPGGVTWSPAGGS